ncbi:MAG TPA: polysaccharide biosynthesis/export family protein [Hyphomicrobiaceae bacterium]|nr:polysaccharide biosynthesis/export family protein [Hyphomicrobiaceae bacterium]
MRRSAAIGMMALIAATGMMAGCANEAPRLDQSEVGRRMAGAEPRLYRLGVGDKVKLTVFGEGDLSGTFEVNGAGQLPVPLVGDISARDKTIGELRDAIAARLAKGYLKNPKVSIEILSYRPIYVHGEVRSGGEFAFKNGLRIRDAVAMAGGYSYRANQTFVLVSRSGGAEEFRIDLPSDLAVMPGDNIRIPERFF